MNSDKSYLNLVKIWIIFTFILALCGAKLGFLVNLWWWFYLACLICAVVAWVVMLFLHPFRADRSSPPRERPYDDE